MDIYYTNKKINTDELSLQKEEVEYTKWFSVDEIEELINKGEIRKGNIIPFHKTLEYIKNKRGKGSAFKHTAFCMLKQLN